MGSDLLESLAPVAAFLVVAAVVAAVRARYLTPGGRIRRAMRAAPRRLVADAEPGALVRVVGRVVARGETLRAPLSGRRCVVHDLLVTRRGSRAAVSFDRGVLLHVADGRDFLVDDGSGRALVEVESAELLLTPEVVDVRRAAPLPEGVSALLRERRIDPGGLLGLGARLRCSEGALVEGAVVAAVGMVRRGDAVEGGGDAAPLTVVGPGDRPALVSDDPAVLR